MFRKSDPNPQLDMFSSPSMLLNSRASKRYTDPKAWHNVFYHFVTSKIDETLFEPLFPKGKKSGRPNAPIRILVAMSILKEGFGCSDEDMFDRCEFDLLVRRALGIDSISDAGPSLDTWYLFRRRLCKHETSTGEDLMKKCFEQVTRKQVVELNISGKVLRMDSTLIGSNIAKSSRYELVHKTMVRFLNTKEDLSSLSEQERRMAESYKKENSSKTVYRSDKDELQNRLLTLGEFVHLLLSVYTEHSTSRDLLTRVFNDQFVIIDGKVTLRDKKKISSSSMQSPYDPDAAHRNKNGQSYSGYSKNAAETVEKKKPSIIVSIRVEQANFADNHYLQDSYEDSQRVVPDKTEEVDSDGAFQSPENREFAERNGFQLKTGKMQGGSRWDLIPHDEDGLTLVDKTTGKRYEGVPVVNRKSQKKQWRIPWNDKSGWRYFSEDAVKTCQIRKQIESVPEEELHKRNNVEATMFQLKYHTRNGKSRYRGLQAHRLFAYHRSMWINMRRIYKYLSKSFQRPIFCFLGHLRENFRCFFRRDFRFSRTSEILSEPLRKVC